MKYVCAPAALALLAGVGTSPLFAQVTPATVSGVVLQAGARTAVEGAEVTVLETRLRSLSSRLGEFRFDEVEPGVVILRVTHPGYRTRTDSVAVAPGERVEVRLTLSAEAIELEPITVVARRGTLGTGITGQYPGMTRQEIDQVLPRTRHLADLIRTANIPGLRILERSIPGVEVSNYCVEHPRARTGRFGADACLTMNIFVDGRPVVDVGEVFGSMAPETIERFEILSPLHATPIYGAAGARGVVLIETRSGVGATDRRLPTFARDLAPFAVALALTRSSAAELYNGAAIFTHQQAVANLIYREQIESRLGGQLSVRSRVFTWFPELELTGFYSGGGSVATFQDAFGRPVRQEHDFSTYGVELAARPRLTKGERWDLAFLFGPVLARESIEANSQGTFPGAPGLGESVRRHMTRSWNTVGAVVGADFEWVLSPRSSLLVGGRWRALTAGDGGEFFSDQDAAGGADLLNLPQAANRKGRRSISVGYVLRLGTPAS